MQGALLGKSDHHQEEVHGGGGALSGQLKYNGTVVNWGSALFHLR